MKLYEQDVHQCLLWHFYRMIKDKTDVALFGIINQAPVRRKLMISAFRMCPTSYFDILRIMKLSSALLERYFLNSIDTYDKYSPITGYR